MNYMPRWIIVGIVSVGVMPSWAATVIERGGVGENKQLVTLNEHQARIETAERDIYTLLDLKEKKVYVINSKEKSILKMDIEGKPIELPELPSMHQQQRQKSSQQDEPVKAKLVKMGSGPTIAGYSTVGYQITANEKVCSETYFAKEAAKIPSFQAFLEAIHKLSSSRKPPRPKGMPIHPCQQAHDELEAESNQLGIPMKMVMKGSKRKGELVTHEITKVETDVKVSPAIFTLPKDYKIITEQEMQAERQAKIKQWQEQARQQPGRWQDDNRQQGGYYPPPPERWQDDDRQPGGYYPPPPERWQDDDRQPGGYYPPPPPPRRWQEEGKQEESDSSN